MGSHGKSTPRLALIGGTGLDAITGFEPLTDAAPVTAFGPASAPLASGRLGGLPVLFLARHGTAHSIPPHAINYRANIAALREAGATHVVAVAAVGGIGPNCGAGALVVPDQLIDYTWGREHAFASTVLAPDSHFDFTEPYCAELRAALLAAGAAAGVALVDGGVYGATQGPRLETAAEIRRLARDFALAPSAVCYGPARPDFVTRRWPWSRTAPRDWAARSRWTKFTACSPRRCTRPDGCWRPWGRGGEEKGSDNPLAAGATRSRLRSPG